MWYSTSPHEIVAAGLPYERQWTIYQGADKSLARPWKETSYSDQEL